MGASTIDDSERLRADPESRYRGGAATSLEVLDAYASAVDAAVRLSEAISRYRIAQSVVLRWSQP
jgi:outer membrane protein TolC